MFAGRLAQFAIAFLSIKLMTTFLSPVEVGKVTLITSATAFFALFLVNPVGMFINRRLHAWVGAGFLKHYFHLFCGYLLGVTALAAALMWGLLQTRLWDIALSPVLCAALVAGSLLFNTICQTLIPSMIMLGRPRPFIILTVATLIVGLVASILLVELFGANAVTWLAGLILSQMLFSVIAYKFFFCKWSFECRSSTKANYQGLFNFAWPIAVAVGFNWLYMQGYRFVLADRFGLADLGLFAAGYGLASSLTTACETVTTTWFQPRFYQDANSTCATVRGKAWGNYASMMIPFTILSSSCIFMTAPYLTTIMLGASYQTAVSFVMAGALAEWGRTLFNIVSLEAHGKMSTRKLIIPSFIGMFAASITMVIPIYLEKIEEVPLALLVGSLAATVAICQRELLIGIDWHRIMKVTAIVAFLSVVFGLCEHSLLPFFGHFEPYIALLIALSLWGGIAWILLRLRVSAP